MQKNILFTMLFIAGVFYASLASASGVDQYTKLLIHSDTYDWDLNFEDSSQSAHVITPYSQAHHSTDLQHFGTSAMYFDGAGDYLSIQDHEGFHFGIDNFTIDLWVHHLANSGNYENYVNYSDHGGTATHGFLIRRKPDLTLQILIDSDGSGWEYIYSTTETISSNGWHHIAIVRDGNTIKPFLDGNLMTVSNPNYSNSISSAPSILTIGAEFEGGAGVWSISGYIDEVRISKGIARWTSNFTPPATPYTQCIADYNDDGVVDENDLVEKQSSVLQELQDWTECWKQETTCQ